MLLGISIPMATAGLLTCILPASHSMFTIKRCKTHGKRSSRKNVSDHVAYRNKTLTAAGLSGLLTRFPFNHYAQTMPAAAGSGSKPIAFAKVQ